MAFNLLPIALGVGSQLIGGMAGNAAARKQRRAITASANRALSGQLADLTGRAGEERSAAQLVAQTQREMSLAEIGLAEASASDSNVSGASIDAATSALKRRANIAQTTTLSNLDSVLRQLDRAARGAVAERDNRIAGAPQPTNGGSQILSALSFAAQLAIPQITKAGT